MTHYFFRTVKICAGFGHSIVVVCLGENPLPDLQIDLQPEFQSSLCFIVQW